MLVAGHYVQVAVVVYIAHFQVVSVSGADQVLRPEPVSGRGSLRRRCRHLAPPRILVPADAQVMVADNDVEIAIAVDVAGLAVGGELAGADRTPGPEGILVPDQSGPGGILGPDHDVGIPITAQIPGGADVGATVRPGSGLGVDYHVSKGDWPGDVGRWLLLRSIPQDDQEGEDGDSECRHAGESSACAEHDEVWTIPSSGKTPLRMHSIYILRGHRLSRG